MRLKPAAPWSRVKHSSTEPLRSLCPDWHGVRGGGTLTITTNFKRTAVTYLIKRTACLTGGLQQVLQGDHDPPLCGSCSTSFTEELDPLTGMNDLLLQVIMPLLTWGRREGRTFQIITNFNRRAATYLIERTACLTGDYNTSCKESRIHLTGGPCHDPKRNDHNISNGDTTRLSLRSDGPHTCESRPDSNRYDQLY